MSESGQSDRIPRTPRQILGQVLGRHHRQLMVSGTNCSACHQYHPTSTDLINAMEAAAPPEPPLDVERLREKASALEALVREIAGAPVTIEIPHKYVEVQIDTRTWSEVGEWAGGAAPDRLPSVEALRIAWEAGRAAQEFETAMAAVNAVMGGTVPAETGKGDE